MKRTSRAWLLAIALLIGLAGVACVEPKPVPGNNVLVVGDSLMNQSRDQVSAALRSDGWDPDIEAQGGTTIIQWSDRFALVDTARQPNMIVIELGTNDCGLQGCPDLGPYIDKIMRYTTSATEVLWLNTNEDAMNSPLIGNLKYVNDAIESACSRYAKLFCADMNSEFEGRKDLHAPDGIHWNDQGKQAFADFIRKELQPFRPAAS